LSNHHDPAVAEVTVSETTPQGTQADGVAYGHDSREVSVRHLMGWLIGLFIGDICVIIFLFGLFQFLNHRLDSTENLPSPLFAYQQLPPKPNIEGFRRENAIGIIGEEFSASDPPAGMPDELEQERARDAAKLKEFGIERDQPGTSDPDNTDAYHRGVKITPQMAATVATEGPSQAPPGFVFNGGDLTEASGGLVHGPLRYRTGSAYKE
jgi:hypothetical protein